MKTIAYLDKVIKGDYQIANDILEDLKSWLVNHIQVTDRKYIDYFKRNSLK
jgi:hemerythrin|tara:strand:- start:510 stop:662 length:153 start_codon:yes stop_codon:yes gene_type:complete